MATPRIKTRVLIISDTHGAPAQTRSEEDGGTTEDDFEDLSQDDLDRVITGYREPLPPCDVAIHCGDLTLSSTESQYANTFEMMRAIQAPLKLVIAGNHDKTLDKNCWNPSRRKHLQRLRDSVDQIIAEAEVDNVKLLSEGTHSFTLENGATLKVYASPFTPVYGIDWAYQYETLRADGSAPHNFDIPKGVDFAITHGPPKGILDVARFDNTGAGCPWLFHAIQQAKPRVHCFGHIHEGWGAYLAKWKTDSGEAMGSVKDHVAEKASRTVWKAKPSGYRGASTDYVDQNDVRVPMEDIVKASKQRGVKVDLTDGEYASTQGSETLFVNAAIMTVRYQPAQLPWIVDIDLPCAKEPSERSQ